MFSSVWCQKDHESLVGPGQQNSPLLLPWKGVSPESFLQEGCSSEDANTACAIQTTRIFPRLSFCFKDLYIYL